MVEARRVAACRRRRKLLIPPGKRDDIAGEHVVPEWL